MAAPVRWDVPLLFVIFGVAWAGLALFVLACFHGVRSLKTPTVPRDWSKHVKTQ